MDDIIKLPLESAPLGCIETVGQYLQRNREEKRISVEEVVLHTRIQAVFINAIEEDRFDKIASLVSAKGFVRSYARFLKIDEVETLKRFSDRVTTLSAPLVSPKTEDMPVVHSAVETPLQMSSSQSEAKSRDTEAFSHEPILDLGTVGVKTRIPLPYSMLIGVSAVCLFVVFLLKLFMPWGNEKNEILEPAQTRLEAPALRDTPSRAALVIPTPPSVPSDTTLEKGVMTQAEVPIAASGLNAMLKPFILSLEAREPTWVKVLVDGKGTKDVLLRTGQKAVWQADKTFLLTMGNGGGAEVFLDGKELGFLGKKGEVVRDRLLTRVASEQAAIDND